MNAYDQLMTESGFTDEHLHNLDCVNSGPGDWTSKGATRNIRLLIEEVRRLRQIVHFTTNEPEGVAYAAGYDAGMRAAEREKERELS